MIAHNDQNFKDISPVENSSDWSFGEAGPREGGGGAIISEKIGAWRKRIDLFALEREGGGDGGFIGLSIAKLVSVSPLPLSRELSEPGERSVYIFPKRSDRQSPARHHSLHCSRARSQFVSAAPFRPAVLLTKSRPREIHPRHTAR